MTDPWLPQGAESENSETDQQSNTEFEDNFLESSTSKAAPLPDSENYLQGLERKLQKIKKESKLVEALAEKRQDCLRSLLNEQVDGPINNNEELVALDTPVDNVDSRVQEIYRHLQPVQPITVGETVQIVKYDQLEEQRDSSENVEEETDIPDK